MPVCKRSRDVLQNESAAEKYMCSLSPTKRAAIPNAARQWGYGAWGAVPVWGVPPWSVPGRQRHPRRSPTRQGTRRGRKKAASTAGHEGGADCQTINLHLVRHQSTACRIAAPSKAGGRHPAPSAKPQICIQDPKGGSPMPSSAVTPLLPNLPVPHSLCSSSPRLYWVALLSEIRGRAQKGCLPTSIFC